MISNFIEIITTFPDKEEADRISDYLVRNRFSACCQISGPVTSIYSWDNQMQKENEYILSIKTRAELFKVIEEEIRKYHPYETPQIISLDLIDISEPYRIWLDKNIKYL